jgi:SAM-dependent methyltransferase
VLEVGGPVFSGRYGREVTSTDIVDIDPTNGLATVVGDLAVVDVLPTAAFDCIVVPQTLQYVGDPGAAVRNLHEALLPGGVLLLTVPVAARVDSAAATTDAWRFTPVGLRILLDRGCPDAEITVEAAGNVLTVTAFLQGISAEELRAEEFDVHDPAFPLLAMARVRRAAAR